MGTLLKNLVNLAALVLILFSQVDPVMAQATPTLVSYSVVCDDPNIKLIVEQKVVAAIQGLKGYSVDTLGKSETKLVFVVATFKRKKEKGEDVVGLAVATLGHQGGKITHFENRTFSLETYEDGLTKLVPHMLGGQ